ncbi:methyltransferase type 11 [Brevundimonas sp. GCM10030266]|uniref:methyltransferase type 11 n=1 Tax=Brevundimonas sp. GCM10030266 TaxID=3273386 RepID=UPI0036179C78
MPLRPFILPIVCMAAALTAACDGERGVHITSTRTENNDASGVLTVVEALQCPQTLGSLTRKGSATDAGRTCTYIGPKGAEVTLQLVALDGKTPPQVLKGFEDRLSASLPMAVAGLQAPGGDVATVKTDAAGDRARVTAPGVDIRAEGEDASVSLPGVRIDASGDQASVRIGGLHIDANDSDGTVDIRGAGNEDGDNVSVRARNDTAEVRAVGAGDATRASWMLSDNRASTEGWRRVGYEARGPVGGPLVVATIRSRDRNGGRVFEDAKDLVTLNVGE